MTCLAQFRGGSSYKSEKELGTGNSGAIDDERGRHELDDKLRVDWNLE